MKSVGAVEFVQWLSPDDPRTSRKAVRSRNSKPSGPVVTDVRRATSTSKAPAPLGQAFTCAGNDVAPTSTIRTHCGQNPRQMVTPLVGRFEGRADVHSLLESGPRWATVRYLWKARCKATEFTSEQPPDCVPKVQFHSVSRRGWDMVEAQTNNEQALAEPVRPIIRLWHGPGLGLIVLGQSGVLYTNQTGGYACLHPAAEGWYVPLVDSRYDQDAALKAYFGGPPWNGACATGITNVDADFVDRLLQSSSVSAFLRVDRERLANSHEAWLHVLIGTVPAKATVFPPAPLRSDNSNAQAPAQAPSMNRAKAPVYGFSGYRGILTWCSTD